MDMDHVVMSVYLFISIGKHNIHQFYKNGIKSIGLTTFRAQIKVIKHLSLDSKLRENQNKAVALSNNFHFIHSSRPSSRSTYILGLSFDCFFAHRVVLKSSSLFQVQFKIVEREATSKYCGFYNFHKIIFLGKLVLPI